MSDQEEQKHTQTDLEKLVDDRISKYLDADESSDDTREKCCPIDKLCKECIKVAANAIYLEDDKKDEYTRINYDERSDRIYITNASWFISLISNILLVVVLLATLLYASTKLSYLINKSTYKWQAI